MNQRKQVTLQQATQESPVLARLLHLATDSSARLQAIKPLIPASLRSAVKAGPINGTVWCIILDNNSVAAKLRQLLPAFLAHLRSKGFDIETIRIKVHSAGSADH
jgi:hypothetical protein